MKAETAIAKILSSEATTSLKISKLQTLALRTYPSSPNQKAVIAAYKALQRGATVHEALLQGATVYETLGLSHTLKPHKSGSATGAPAPLSTAETT